MKKLLFAFPIVAFLTAGCNQTPTMNTPSNNINTNQSANNSTTPAPMPTQTQSQKPDLMAIVSTMAYGYKINITVNGQDIGLEGNASGGARLFNKENSYYQTASPEMLKKNGVLIQGNNTISITYTKTGPTSKDKLHIDLQMDGYASPLFSLDAQDAAGTIQQVIDVEPTQPANFKPIVIQK